MDDPLSVALRAAAQCRIEDIADLDLLAEAQMTADDLCDRITNRSVEVVAEMRQR